MLIAWGSLWTDTHVFGDSPEEQPVAHRWLVVVEDLVLDSGTAEPPHRYKLKVFEAIAKERRLICNRDLRGAGADDMKYIARALRKSSVLPSLDDSGKIARSTKSASEIQIVVRQQTNNRRMDVWFNGEEAERLGVQDDVNKLISLVNGQLAAVGHLQRIRLHQHE